MLFKCSLSVFPRIGNNVCNVLLHFYPNKCYDRVDYILRTKEENIFVRMNNEINRYEIIHLKYVRYKYVYSC